MITCRTSQSDTATLMTIGFTSAGINILPDAVWDDGQISQITRVLVFWTFLVESRDLAYPKDVIGKKFIKKLKISYRIAHAMTQMHASIPKSDSSERSGKPDPEFDQNHDCLSE